MDMKAIAELGSTGAIIFLAVFQVVRLEKTLSRVEQTLARLCGLVHVEPKP